MSHTHEFAVIGLGRFGASLAVTLEEQGHYVLGIDDNIDIVQSLSSHLTHIVALDATDDAALVGVDIAHFETVVVAIGTDFENSLLTTVALKQMGVKTVICKAINARQKEILERIGADRVLLPEMEAGSRLALELINPGLMERFAISPGYSIAEIELPAKFVGKTLATANLRSAYGMNVLVIKRGKQMMTSPGPQTTLQTGDLLVVLAEDVDIERLSKS